MRARYRARRNDSNWQEIMSSSFSLWSELFGKRQSSSSPVRLPVVGEVYARRPEIGPVEYAQVIGVYKEAAEIHHVRFRLAYGYQEKVEDLGERTLAVALFQKRFTQHVKTDTAAE